MRRPRRPTPIEAWMYVKDPEKLRRARKRAGFTQVDISRLVPVTQQYISALETGTDRDCSQQVAERLCRYLDIELEDYFEARSLSRTAVVTTSSRGSGSAA